MFCDRIIILLPPIEIAETKIAGCIVWIGGGWLVKEAGFCKLHAGQPPNLNVTDNDNDKPARVKVLDAAISRLSRP